MIHWGSRRIFFPFLWVAGLCLAAPVPAATFTVTSSLDDGTGGTLRSAIQAANDDCVAGDAGETDVIVFDITASEIQLSSALPALCSNLTIEGPGAGNLTIRGNGSFRIFQVIGENIGITGLTLTGGNGVNVASFGGGVWVTGDGSATLSDVNVTGNTAPTGGGIANGGTLVLLDSVVSENEATGGTFGGGGIYNSGSLTLVNVTVADNEAILGGGIYHHEDGEISTMNVIVSGNTAQSGAGIYAADDLEISNSIIANNEATGEGALVDTGAGIHAQGDVTVTGSRIEGNQIIDNSSPFVQRLAGGIFGSVVTVVDSVVADNTAATGSNLGSTGSAVNAGEAVTISGSTFSGNTSTGTLNRFDGVINISSSGSASTMINSTVSGNSARQGAAVILRDGSGSTLSVVNSTITSNLSSESGHYVGISTNREVILENTIVYDNGIGDCNTGSNIVSNGHNIDGDGSCNLNGPGDRPNSDPLLGPLADNGGPTPTHALLAGSPAIDAGNNDSCPDTDQRGSTRPRDGDGNGAAVCDIGAYEYNPPDLLIADLTVDADPVTVGDEVVIGISVGNAGEVAVDDVLLEISLPAELGFVSATPGCDEAGGIVSCAIGSLDASSNEDIEVITTANEAGSADIVATVTGDVTEANQDNNRATLTLTINAGSVNGGGGGGGSLAPVSLLFLLAATLLAIIRGRLKGTQPY